MSADKTSLDQDFPPGWSPHSEDSHTWEDERTLRRFRLRRVKDRLVAALAIACVALILYPLLDILYTFIYRGVLAISVTRLTQTTLNGGVANAIAGTLDLMILSAIIAIPFGVFGGIYLAEFSGQSRYANLIRFLADVLSGIPSIILGYLGFVVLILYFHWGYGTGGSLLAGSIVLAILMLPYILRTTELSIRKVPQNLREAAIALGATKTQMVNKLTVLLALPGILTGIILSMSISIGETAPLLYTVGNSNYYPCGVVNCPASYLTYIIWTVANTSITDGTNLAYLSAFLLVSIVVVLNISARIGLRRFSKV